MQRGKKTHTKKGLTFVEIMIVVAIIAMLTAVILVNVNASRERANKAAFASYVSQVTQLVESAVTAGAFNGISEIQRGCLGNYPGNVCWSATWNNANPAINAALQQIGAIPPGVYTPYWVSHGTIILVNPGSNYVRVYAPVGVGNADMCDDFGWKSVAIVAPSGNTYCYTQFSIQ